MFRHHPTRSTDSPPHRRFAPFVPAVLLLGLGGLVALGCSDSDSTDNAPSAQGTTDNPSSSSTPATQNLVELADEDERFFMLEESIQVADYVEFFSGEGPYTVLAPVNDAFTAVQGGEMGRMMSPQGQDRLREVLQLHVIEGRVRAADLSDGQQVTTLGGATLRVEKSGSSVTFIDPRGARATVVEADIPATNGVIHAIDTMMFPADS